MSTRKAHGKTIWFEKSLLRAEPPVRKGFFPRKSPPEIFRARRRGTFILSNGMISIVGKPCQDGPQQGFLNMDRAMEATLQESTIAVIHEAVIARRRHEPAKTEEIVLILSVALAARIIFHWSHLIYSILYRGSRGTLGEIMWKKYSA